MFFFVERKHTQHPSLSLMKLLVFSVKFSTFQETHHEFKKNIVHEISNPLHGDMNKSNIFAMTHQHKADVRSVCVGLTCKADTKLIGSLLKTEADSLVFLAVEVFPANCEVRFLRLQFFRDRLHPPCTCGANSTTQVECGHMSVNNLHRERMSHIRGVPKNGLSLRNLFNLTNFFSK